MTPKRLSSKLPLAADIVGLPATQLANMLDDILDERKGGAPASGISAGLLGLADTLRASLALAPHLEGVEAPPDTGTEEMLPELRIVETLLANIPRDHGGTSSPIGEPAAPPAPKGGQHSGLTLLPEAAGDHDLAAVREALRRFAGKVLPDQVFHEVMAITAGLSGHSYAPATRSAVPPTRTAEAAPSADDARGDRLLADALAIQAALDGLNAVDTAEPKVEPVPKTEPPTVEAAPPLNIKVKPSRRGHVAPTAKPQPVAETQSEAAEAPAPTAKRTSRRGRAAPPPLPEPVSPVVAEPSPPPAMAPEPPPAVAEPPAPDIAPSEPPRALSVKVKPSRRSKAKPPPVPAVALAPEPETQAAPESALPEPPPPAEPEAPEVALPEAPQPAEPEVPEVAGSAEPEPADDVLVLTEVIAEATVSAGDVPAFAEAEDATPDIVSEPSRPIAPSPVDAPAQDEAAAVPGDLAALVEAVIFAHRPAEAPIGAKHGELILPERADMLEALLADPPPATDFVALDLLTACWGKGAHDIKSRALLAAAQNLSRNFGLPGKLPMASCRAWKMLDSEVFQEELAHHLGVISSFIADWNRTQRNFLILEFGEIELIEHLFEALHPAEHLDLLANVMNVKALSNRRLGLLRRVPNRMRKQVQPMLPAQHEDALVLLAHTKALLEKIAAPNGFPPIIDAASKALEEIDKLMKQAAAASAPPLPGPPGGGGMALGRIG